MNKFLLFIFFLGSFFSLYAQTEFKFGYDEPGKWVVLRGEVFVSEVDSTRHVLNCVCGGEDIWSNLSTGPNLINGILLLRGKRGCQGYYLQGRAVPVIFPEKGNKLEQRYYA